MTKSRIVMKENEATVVAITSMNLTFDNYKFSTIPFDATFHLQRGNCVHSSLKKIIN